LRGEIDVSDSASLARLYESPHPSGRAEDELRVAWLVATRNGSEGREEATVAPIGAHLQAGATTVKLDGQPREVRCKIRSISGFSAHADESELLDWLRHFATGRHPGEAGYPRRVFLVHGDPEAQIAMEPKVRDLGFATHIPHWHERVTLD
jgi:Cft2 family RNA processing exonuclease